MHASGLKNGWFLSRELLSPHFGKIQKKRHKGRVFISLLCMTLLKGTPRNVEIPLKAGEAKSMCIVSL